MNFEMEMGTYFKLKTLKERKEKIDLIVAQLEKNRKMNDPFTNLNMAEVIIEYCLLMSDNEERLQQYDQALELACNARHILKEKKQIAQLVRSYHIECFIKFHTMKYKDEEIAIQDIFELGEKIINVLKRNQNSVSDIENKGYYSLGLCWRAYGLVQQLINKSKELSIKQKHDILEKTRKLAHKALELSKNSNNRDAHILSAYIFAFVEQLPQRTLYGDKATTEEDFIGFMSPYEILFEIAHACGSIEFEYLALLNYIRLNLLRIVYAAGLSERKREIFNDIVKDFKKLSKYESIIHLPHLHFYQYSLKTYTYTTIIYFEAVSEERFQYYLNEALKSAEKMKNVYVSGAMQSAHDKIEMHHILNEVYRMKASFATSRIEKIDYLKKSEDLLLEDERISATWSPQVYNTWRDLSSIYFELSKVERNQIYLKKCVFFAKKAYSSALETDVFKDAFFEAYKIAIIAEDYQDYNLSITNYGLALDLIDKILSAGKDYPYYHDLMIYLQARLHGVKAKEEHFKGNYAQAMDLYRKASSLLQAHDLYVYESLLYDAYSLFEEASMSFIEENYKETLNIMFNITSLFDEAVTHYAEDYEPQFQYFIDRRAYDLQELFFESIKTFCIAQSNILQSLIYRNTGQSEKAIELLKEANALLTNFVDRNVHIAGYYLFANGLYGLEKSEVAIRESDFKNAAAYLAGASDQFESATQVLTSDVRLRKLCKGLKAFCQGWMYALEIMRRGKDLNNTELNTNYTLAQKSFLNAIKDLKPFRKTSNGVSGFQELVSYVYYSLLFQKTDNPSEKTKFKNIMSNALNEALQYFKEAEDMERYGFTRDLLSTLPQIEDVRETVFKPIDIPFVTYTPVFDTIREVEPTGVDFTVSLDKTQIEVYEKILYTIQITSDTSIYIKKIEGVFPKKGVKVISGIRLAKNGAVKLNRLLSPGQSLLIEFRIQAFTPLFSRKHPQLIYLSTKNEKFRVFSTPFAIQVYPKDVLKTGLVRKIDEKISRIMNIMDELRVTRGEFPIIYHNINSYHKTLSEYLMPEENKKAKKRSSKKKRFSQAPIQQMAFVDPLGDVNILYDLSKHLYPRSITSLLNIIIHEKFGHGFFYQNTTLGKKLLELEYHRKGLQLLMEELEEISNNYAFGVQWLCMSISIPNEGFAVWITLKTLEKLIEIYEHDQQFIQQLQLEIKNIKKMMFESESLKIKHDYFSLKYETPINPYARGYDLFSQIEDKYGEKCVSKALEIATDVSLTRRQISRMPNTLRNDKNCADKRLEKIALSNLEIEKNIVETFETAAKKLLL